MRITIDNQNLELEMCDIHPSPRTNNLTSRISFFYSPKNHIAQLNVCSEKIVLKKKRVLV